MTTDELDLVDGLVAVAAVVERSREAVAADLEDQAVEEAPAAADGDDPLPSAAHPEQLRLYLVPLGPAGPPERRHSARSYWLTPKGYAALGGPLRVDRRVGERRRRAQ